MNAKTIIRMLPYKLKEDAETELYKNYIARCLRLITENTAKSSGGSYIKAEYADLITPQKVETRTSEEIKQSFIKRLGKESDFD